MRTLPLRLAPVDGESLPGYVARYAHTFALAPGDVIRALGLDRGTGIILHARRYGAWLSSDQLQWVAFATGIDPITVNRMLLSRFSGRAFEQPAGSLDHAFSGAAHGHQLLIRSSRFCPHCLRENGAWLVHWQLGWSFACVSHRVLLVRRCPQCATVPKSTLRVRWPADDRGGVSDPACCAQRHGRALCRGRLATAATDDVCDQTLAAQRRINALLDGEVTPTLAGAELAPPVYLRDLLTLCNLLDRPPRPSPTPTPPARRGRRLHDHPAALAAVLPAALQLADLPDPDALTKAVRELANRRYRADGQTLPVSKAGPMSEQLTAVMQTAVSGSAWAPASLRMGFDPRAHHRPDDLNTRLRACHVPQLLWVQDYHREISELFDFDDFTHWLGRRFCSVLLARMLAPLDWQAAVRYLDFPETFINDGYNTTFAKLRSNNRFDELSRRVKRIANQHAEHRLIDYKRRRSRLADWDGIQSDTWYLLQPRTRPASPFYRIDAPARRAHASVWLWCQLTSGHERAAPVALPTDNLAHHTYFIRDTVPALRDRLLILGELLLATPADARSTLPNRLAATLHQRGYLAENFHLDTIDPLLSSRVLAHVSAYTGVDIPSLTTPSQQSHAPPAVTHARLLAARLLRQTALASWRSIAGVIGGDANHLGENNRRYQAALDHDQHLADELTDLVTAIENWDTPAPTPPSARHADRMRQLAIAIKDRADQLLATSHGPYVAERTSIALCRQHTDLTCPTIAAIHGVTDAQPSWSQDTVARLRRDDPDYTKRYQRLLATCKARQQAAGFANANLNRGLTTQPSA